MVMIRNFKSSGDIKDKISWSCNVEYVGDDSDSSSSGSNYSDYRINGKAGESQNVSRENTVNSSCFLIDAVIVERITNRRLVLQTKKMKNLAIARFFCLSVFTS